MSRLFDGSSDWAKVVATNQGAVTIAAWVKAVTFPGSTVADVLWTWVEDSELASQPASTKDKTLFLQSDGTLTGYVFDGAAKVVVGAGVTTGTWHHLGLTCSAGDGLRVWVDGTASSPTAMSAGSFTGYSAPRLAFAPLTNTSGSNGAASIERGNMKLYKVGAWSRVLTQGEFDNLVLGQDPSTAAASGLLIEILSDTTFVDTQGATVTLTGTASDGDNPTFGGGPADPVPYTPNRQLTPIFAQ